MIGTGTIGGTAITQIKITGSALLKIYYLKLLKIDRSNDNDFNDLLNIEK